VGYRIASNSRRLLYDTGTLLGIAWLVGRVRDKGARK
jgi:hypothetical protein